MNLPDEFTYQGFARQKVVARKRTAVIAVPGSGKTRPVVDGLVELGRIYPPGEGAYKFPHGPILVLCTGPAIATWLKQLPQWSNCPELADQMYVVRGTKTQRLNLWDQARTSHSGIYITNYSVFLRDFAHLLSIDWAATVADEYHKCMRRKKKNKTYAAFTKLSRHMEVVILASGSLVNKTPASMFTAFQIIAPKVFRSYWKFVTTYCIVNEGLFGKEILGVKNVQALKDITDKYMAYIPEEVVADQLPKGLRVPVHAEMTKEQTKIYNALSTDMIAILEDTDAVVVAPNVLTKIIRQRQLLCCPRILDPSLGMGGGFDTIVDRLEEDTHVVIFVPFRPACDHMQTELLRRGRKNVYLIRGGIGHDDQTREIEAFKETRGIMVCTIAYAESFDLETCKTSYFLGYDYSLDINKQAEGRTRRAISTHEFVTWNYVKYLHTLDEDLLENLSTDMRTAQRILSRPEALINALKGIQP